MGKEVKRDYVNESQLAVELAKREVVATREQAKRVIKELKAIILEHLAEGHEIGLSGLVKFGWAEVKERKGVNPRTKEEILIPAKSKVKVRTLKGLRDLTKEL